MEEEEEEEEEEEDTVTKVIYLWSNLYKLIQVYRICKSSSTNIRESKKIHVSKCKNS